MLQRGLELPLPQLKRAASQLFSIIIGLHKHKDNEQVLNAQFNGRNNKKKLKQENNSYNLVAHRRRITIIIIVHVNIKGRVVLLNINLNHLQEKWSNNQS